jgi:hypothetical protein
MTKANKILLISQYSKKTTMKKLVLGALTMFFLASALVSCNSGKSDEQIAKEAKEAFEKDKETTLKETADAECQKVIDAKFEAIKTAKAEEKAKAEEEAKTKKKGK